jgi:hypothetical protein
MIWSVAAAEALTLCPGLRACGQVGELYDDTAKETSKSAFIRT